MPRCADGPVLCTASRRSPSWRIRASGRHDARVNESFAATTSPVSADLHHVCDRPGAVVCMASTSGLGGAHAYRIAPMTQPPAPAITMPAMTFLAAGVPGSGEWKAQMPMLALTSKLS